MATLSIRIDAELKDLLRDIAASNKRTLSDEFLYRVERTLREENLLESSQAEVRIKKRLGK